MICGNCRRSDAAVTVEHVKHCDGRQDFGPATTGPYNSNKLNAALAKGGVATLDRPVTPPNSRDRRDSKISDLKTARSRVSAGRYAVPGEDGHLKFYQIDKPTEGKWAGFTFIKVQAGDELHRLKGMDAELAVLLKIGADQAEASRAYGRHIGSCGVCGRTLTNPESRKEGIGPVCAGKMGW